MDKSVLAVILQTWRSIEIPPKPSKKAVRIILKEIFLQAMEEIIFIPFVISKMPVKNPCMKLVSIFRKESKGFSKIVMLFNMPLALRIDRILENMTINPPIKRIVEMLLVILSARISPRLEKEALFFGWMERSRRCVCT